MKCSENLKLKKKKDFPRRLNTQGTGHAGFVLSCHLFQKNTLQSWFLACQPISKDKNPMGNRAQPPLLGWDRD